MAIHPAGLWAPRSGLAQLEGADKKTHFALLQKPISVAAADSSAGITSSQLAQYAQPQASPKAGSTRRAASVT